MPATAMPDTLSDAAQKVLQERYLQPGEDWDALCWRVANVVADGDAPEWAPRFHDLIYSRQFIPGSPILSNAGKQGMCYSSCFVLPIKDDMRAICDTMTNMVMIHKAGGGTGFSFSSLRPKGSRVSTTNSGVATGPVGFLKMYDAVTEQVKQGGVRRGANMGILRVDHPDILEFIDCKRSGGITNFNISVGITDEFMRALADRPSITLWSVRDPNTGLESVLEDKGAMVTVGEVWQRICDAAWATGDPGLVFLDRINASSANPIPPLGPVEATNPCGEQPLYPNDVCNLGSLNLGRFVQDGEVAYGTLEAAVRTAVRFLDNVIDVNNYPTPDTDYVARNARRIGLGVMGWADMLIRLETPYASQQAVDLAEEVMQHISRWGWEASMALAKERGPFPLFDESIYKDGEPRRNSTVTTIAPTGTIGLIADASNGIEPLFALDFEHNNQQGRSMRISNQAAQQLLDSLPPECRAPEGVLATAHEIAPLWHVKMQAAFQRYTDNAVSKTINLPADATATDVEMAYRMAWETDCMGITVFRDGCKGAQVLNVKPKETYATGGVVASTTPYLVGTSIAVKNVPADIAGNTYKVQSPDGTVNVTVNRDNEGPVELFVNVGRAGSDIAALAEAIGRSGSLLLRTPSGISQPKRLALFADQLRGLGGSRTAGFGAERVSSVPDAVARALDRHVQQFGSEQPVVTITTAGAAAPATPLSLPVMAGGSVSGGSLCPACGNLTLAHQSGCANCRCGYSEC